MSGPVEIDRDGGTGMKWIAFTALAAGVATMVLGADQALAQLQLTPQTIRQSPQAQPTPRGQQPRRDARREGDPNQPGQQRRRDRRQQEQTAATQPEQQPVANPNFPRRLQQADLRSRFFDGRPINARALGGGLFTMVFHPDGRMERTAANGQTTNGRWRFLGDAYCSRWEGNSAEVCHTVVQEGQTVRVVRNTRAVATWSRDGAPRAP